MGLDLTHILPITEASDSDGYQFFTEQELAENQQYQTFLGSYFADSDDGVKLLYYKEMGFQRKGMNSKFYEDFQSDYYFDFKTVQRAYDYLQGDPINSLKQLRINFRKYFIDNFVPGMSVFL